MKGLIKLIAKLYLFPVRYNAKLKTYIRDVILFDDSPHLKAIVKIVNLKLNKKEFRDYHIIDVGGADGGTSLFFKRNFRNAKIIYFEPNPTYSDKLSEGIDKRQIALGDKKGLGILSITANNFSSSLNEINSISDSIELKEKLKVIASSTVEISTLDLELKPIKNILLIKMDTQGYELNILKGGTETLRKTKFIVLEMLNHQTYKNAPLYFEIDEYMRKNFFRLINLTVEYKERGVFMHEFDAIYENTKYK